MPSRTDHGHTAGPEVATVSHVNAFGLLRLLLASGVVVQHALALTGHEDWTYLGLGNRASIGDVAVAGFFGVSGYLLYASVSRNSPRRYLRLRFHRLFPGFWVTLLVMALVAGPLAAWMEGSIRSYRLFGGQSASTYVVNNSALVMFQHNIGGLLAHNPWPTAFDGSLWSLAPEFICYLVLLAATVAASRLRIGKVSGLLLVLTAAAAGFVLLPVLFGSTAGQIPMLGGLALTFFSGSLIAERGWLTRPDRRRAGALLLVASVVVALGAWTPLGPPVLAAAVVATGRSFNSGWVTRVDAKADLSYGMYLYHFPVIQLLVLAGLGNSVIRALLAITPVTLAITAAVATLSWFAVEAPAQRRGRRSLPLAAT